MASDKKSSVKSIMHLVVGYVSLKHCSIVFCNFDGQIGMQPSLKYITFDHVIKFLDTVDFSVSNSHAMCCDVKPSWNMNTCSIVSCSFPK